MLIADSRAVVTDDGRQIRLTVYEGRDGREVELSPIDALQLADDLLGVALPQLANIMRRVGGS
jgi:hypothetical protein